MNHILSSRIIIKFSGPASYKFLNSLTTNKIETDKLSYHYFLNNQGRYLFDAFIFMDKEGNIFIDINLDISENFLKHIRMRKLRSNFEITIESHASVIFSENEIIADNLIFSLSDPRGSQLGYRGIAYNYNGKDGEDNYHDKRIKLGIVEGCYDMICERSIPIEFNGEEQNALSFDKGCYVGQEVISRAKHQGVVRKKVFLLKCSGIITEIAKGDNVSDGENNKIGIACSYHGQNLLALLNIEILKELKQKKSQLFISSQSFYS